jgi:hypothetical protein
MSMADIRRRFPSLTSDNHQETSDEDFNYNCLAFVLGDFNNWWQPPEEFEKHSHAPGIYWPPGFPTDSTLETVTAIIRLHGYTVEIDRDSEPSAPAIAIFASGDEWAHFAKYSDGHWYSKVGRDHDISHSSLILLEGPDYGKVVRILSRPS